MRKLLLLLLTVFTLCISHENAFGKTISAGINYCLAKSRYVFVPEQLTWNEHNDRAKAMGGKLASITSAEENQQVTRISGGGPVWIGGIRKGRGNGSGADHWYWSDGQTWSYTNWHPGEPNSSDGHENRVHLGLQAPGTWNDAPEGWQGPAVYEIPVTASEPTAPPAQTSKFMPSRVVVSGAGSPEVNGTYVFVQGEHKNRFFGTIAGHYQHTINPKMFIAFQDCGTAHQRPEWNKWMIISGNAVRYAAHTGGKINVPPREGEWERVDEWAALAGRNPGNHPPPNLSYVEDEVTQSRFMFVPEEMTWNEHSHRAQVMGGNLASITSAEENEQVTRISGGGPVWIGGIRKGRGNGPGADHWYWSDGRPWTYTNWASGEPNNHNGDENRVQHLGLISPLIAKTYNHGGGKWNDVWKDWVGPAVYELPVTLSTISANPSPTLLKESIEILEAVPGKPVRFKINNPPRSNDAWVGIYPLSASDQDHGEHKKRWEWIRDIDVNNASIPEQPEGDWSIRVFSDGGYTLHERINFPVKEKRELFTSDHNINQAADEEGIFLEAEQIKPSRERSTAEKNYQEFKKTFEEEMANKEDNESKYEKPTSSSNSNIRVRVSSSGQEISKVAVIGKASELCNGSLDDGQGLAEVVEGELLGIYGVVERKHLEDILDEQRLALGGLVLEDTDFAQAGCLAGAQGTVLASYGCLQGKTKIQVKLVDCSTSDMCWSATGFEVSEFELLDELRVKLETR